MNEIGVEHFYIELLKETPCENKEQLKAIEGEYIRKYGTLNSKIENRTIEEWREQYKETKKEKSRMRYEEKREDILMKQKERRESDIEGYNEQRKKYRNENPEKYKEYSKKSYYKNIDKVKARREEKIECELCGNHYRRDYMKRHLKIIHS
eukprot:Skav227055  [mRNA]  locus=scaffold72:837717:838169:- [translate_table: standard]